MKKKINKFFRDPKLFVKDMLLKRARKVKAHVPEPVTSNYTYSVISAVYNLQDYLPKYFDTICNQSIGFKKNIRLILIDDGSTDNSRNIIKEWQARYPDNIIYIYQENSGQASARNLGFEYAESDWIIFIDPDDFIAPKYFSEADQFLFKNKNIALLNCNIISFNNENNKHSDTHQLKYRFEKQDVVLTINDLRAHINNAVSGVFFSTKIIMDSGLRFDANLRPNFEDAHFVSCYLMELNKGVIGYSSKAIYYHVQRESSSLLPKINWNKKSLYGDVLEFGILDILNKAKIKYGNIPKHIQRVALYQLVWYIRKAVNNTDLFDLLDDIEKTRLHILLEKIFSKIDEQTIINFELAGCGSFHKMGMLSLFKKNPPVNETIYLEDYDFKKSQVLIRYFAPIINLELFMIGGQDVFPAYMKTVQHDFFAKVFLYERKIWLPLQKSINTKLVTAKLGSINAKIVLGGKSHIDGITVEKIIHHFTLQRPKHKVTPFYAGCWLLMDRDNQADDNAEHLYRYLLKNHPEQSAYFVLNEDSHDWIRLQNDGFKLLPFGSADHEDALHSCSKIISSHAAQFVTDYFKDKSLRSKHFIFLQHGVIHNDQSSLFAPSWKKFDVFVTSAKKEYDSIAGDFGKYKFTKKEVQLTGLPRHDFLYLSKNINERLILVMPTWRAHLVGKVVSGTKRELLDDFDTSQYAMQWTSLFKNEKLLELARLNNYKIVFFPHANIQPYISNFKLPAEIEIMDHANASIQELFLKAAILVTDYSSVAFEMAYLKKPVVYYQFDEKEFFLNGHYSKGYFDYRNDGFGPVETEENAVVTSIEHLISQNAENDEQYKTRVNEFFPLRDGKACERVYDAIIALDKTTEPLIGQENVLRPYAYTATNSKAWTLAIKRWRKVIASHDVLNTDINIVAADKLELICALRHVGRLFEAQSILKEIKPILSTIDLTDDLHQKFIMEQSLLHVLHYDWDEAISSIDTLSKNSETRQLLVQAKAEAGIDINIDYIALNIPHSDQQNHKPIIVSAWHALAQRNWKLITETLENNLDLLQENSQMHLMFIKAYRKLGNHTSGADELKRYGEFHGKDRNWILETIRHYYETNKLQKLVSLFEKLYPEGITAMPVEDGLLKVKVNRMLGQVVAAHNEINLISVKPRLLEDLTLEKINIAELQMNWDVVATHWNSLNNSNKYDSYRHALSLRKIGMVEEAHTTLISNWETKSKNFTEWELRADLSEILGKYIDAAESLEVIAKNFTADTSPSHHNRLYQARLMNKISSTAN